MENINLKQLSKELNLAISTVSRALRDSHEVSTATRERVKAMAEKLNYQPNHFASSLRKNKSKTIAVIIPEIENNFFAQIINGVEFVAQQKGYHVLIYLTHEDYIKEQDFMGVLRNGRVDGIMISISNTTTEYGHLEASNRSGMPLVLFDRVCDTIDVPKVITDDTEISFKTTSQLIKHGCRRIAFLSLSDKLSNIHRRISGYERALQRFKTQPEPLVVPCSQHDAQNREAIHALLTGPNRPDAIFAAVEKLAINTFEVCAELGLRVPEDLKVTSFSNSPAAAFFGPPLSTVVQPAYDMGKEAAGILFKLIEQKKLLPHEKHVVLPSVLMERRSSL